MRSITTVATAFLAFFASSALAFVQSKPFYLVAYSDLEKYNNTAFGACHEGAGIEALCVGGKLEKAGPKLQTFRFNTTHAEPTQGLVTYELVGSNFKGTRHLPYHSQCH